MGIQGHRCEAGSGQKRILKQNKKGWERKRKDERERERVEGRAKQSEKIKEKRGEKRYGKEKQENIIKRDGRKRNG